MTTFTALTTLAGRAETKALGEAMEQLEPTPTGIDVFKVEDGSELQEVKDFFLEKPDDTALLVLTTAFGAKPFAVSRLEDRDWVAQVRRELTPVEASRFVVYGKHDAANIPSQKIGLEIKTAITFNTGHHRTTQNCLTAFDALLRQGFRFRNMADIGYGTGILAMTAAATGAVAMIASDIDQIAVATTQTNYKANKLSPKVVTMRAAGFRHPKLGRRNPFDLVFANILANPLKRLAPEIARTVAPGGMIILSGILNRQARGVEVIYADHEFSRKARQVIGEWTTLTLLQT